MMTRRSGHVARRGAIAVFLCSVAAACASPAIESGTAVTTTDVTIDGADPSNSADISVPGSEPPAPEPTIDPAPDLEPVGEPDPIAEPLPTIQPLTGWDAVDRYLDLTVIRGGSQAVSIAVMQDGVIEHTSALGQRTVAGDDPVAIPDRFRIASISKIITAITVLQLVESGVVALDEPVGARIAERVGVGSPVEGAVDITVRNLLTHRSGFGPYEDLFFKNQVSSCPEAAAVGMSRSLQQPPGSGFRYSNMNFCVLGLVIEEVTGRSYADVVADELLNPLGISDMRLAGTFDVGDGDVEHRSDEGRNYMETLGAAGAWIATPADIVAIMNSLDPSTTGWKPLEADTLAVMKTITTDPITVDPDADPEAPATSTEPVIPDSGYGMGLMLFGGDTYGHTGTVESTHAMTVSRPDGVTWAITVSGEYPGSTRQLAVIVHNALRLGGFIDDPFSAVPPPLVD